MPSHETSVPDQAKNREAMREFLAKNPGKFDGQGTFVAPPYTRDQFGADRDLAGKVGESITTGDPEFDKAIRNAMFRLLHAVETRQGIV